MRIPPRTDLVDAVAYSSEKISKPSETLGPAALAGKILAKPEFHGALTRLRNDAARDFT
jgi:hypothetical protein